jgi:MbtH protein
LRLPDSAAFRRKVLQTEVDSMSDEQTDAAQIYKVVVNHEGQYSLWPVNRENPLGWTDAGKTGAKSECLAFVEEVWTDMRPLSLRTTMDEPG